jgi:putative transposase
MLRRRRLPHLYAVGQPLFVTFCLKNSLPRNRRFAAASVTSGEAFAAMDRLLAEARSGPTWLRRPEIAQIVANSLEYGATLGHYELHSWVIMPNHVHLLVTPRVEPSRLLRSLKGSTARNANALLHRTGEPFWQDESHDRLVRSGEEFRQISRYIENNPVKACLVVQPDAYPWSSAWRRETPPQAKGLPHAT